MHNQDIPVEDEAAEGTPAATPADEEADVPPNMAAEAAAAAPRSNPAGAPADAGSKPPPPLLLDEAWPPELSWLEAILAASGFDSWSSAVSSVGRCPLVHDPVLTRPSGF